MRPALLLLGLLLLPACEPRRVDACDDSRAAELPCVDLQIEGGLGPLTELALEVLGDWVGYANVAPADPFELPVAMAVALPPGFTGTMRLEVTATRDRQLRGAGTAVVRDLKPKEHRQVELQLVPPPDGGTTDLRPDL